MFMLFFLIACSAKTNSDNLDEVAAEPDSSEPEEEEVVEKEPVTVTVLVHWTEEMFNERFKEPIEAAFDHITLEQIQGSETKEELEDLFAKGIYPDILFEVSHEDLEYLDLQYDLDELIEKHAYDVDHIQPVFLDSIRAKDKDGRLLGFPYEVIYRALFYNKDIFEKFGQEYPSDDMSWEEAIALGKKLTGEIDGVNYRGLDIGNPDIPLTQLSVNKTDPETGEVLLDQPEFSKYMTLMDEIVDAGEGDNEDFFRGGGRFAEDQTTAMLVEFVQGVNWWKDAPGLDFDIAAVPYWSDNPRVNHRVDNLIPLSIAPYSEVKDAAFEVITYFTEAEYQQWASRNGLGPVSTNVEIQDEFFHDYESARDQNTSAVFAHPHAAPPEMISRWDSFVDMKVADYAETNVDRNEWLREIAEESTTIIEEAKSNQE